MTLPPVRPLLLVSTLHKKGGCCMHLHEFVLRTMWCTQHVQWGCWWNIRADTKKVGTNAAGVPVRHRYDPWSFDDDILTSTPMLQGGQNQLFKVRTYAVKFEWLFRFLHSLFRRAFSFLTVYVQIRSSSKSWFCCWWEDLGPRLRHRTKLLTNSRVEL
jgi:hypothetical protein